MKRDYSKYSQNNFSLFFIFPIEVFLVILCGGVGLLLMDAGHFIRGVLIGGVLAGVIAGNMAERYLKY